MIAKGAWYKVCDCKHVEHSIINVNMIKRVVTWYVEEANRYALTCCVLYSEGCVVRHSSSSFDDVGRESLRFMKLAIGMSMRCKRAKCGMMKAQYISLAGFRTSRG